MAGQDEIIGLIADAGDDKGVGGEATQPETEGTRGVGDIADAGILKLHAGERKKFAGVAVFYCAPDYFHLSFQVGPCHTYDETAYHKQNSPDS